jgi:hypothetical protein
MDAGRGTGIRIVPGAPRMTLHPLDAASGDDAGTGTKAMVPHAVGTPWTL